MIATAKTTTIIITVIAPPSGVGEPVVTMLSEEMVVLAIPLVLIVVVALELVFVPAVVAFVPAVVAFVPAVVLLVELLEVTFDEVELAEVADVVADEAADEDEAEAEDEDEADAEAEDEDADAEVELLVEEVELVEPVADDEALVAEEVLDEGVKVEQSDPENPL